MREKVRPIFYIILSHSAKSLAKILRTALFYAFYYPYCIKKHLFYAVQSIFFTKHHLIHYNLYRF